MAETDEQRASRLCPTKNFFEEHYGDENRRKVKAAMLEAQRLAREDEQRIAAERLLAVRDALVANDVNEAFHQLSELADHGRISLNPFDEWEASSRQPGGAK